jgi:hypothetical protein
LLRVAAILGLAITAEEGAEAVPPPLRHVHAAAQAIRLEHAQSAAASINTAVQMDNGLQPKWAVVVQCHLDVADHRDNASAAIDGGGNMRYFQSHVWMVIAVLSLNSSFASASFDDFDAAVLIKKSFWDNISGVLPMASVEFTGGSVSIVDSILCDSGVGSAKFLVAFKASDPQPVLLTQKSSCNTTAANLVSGSTNTGYDGFAFVSAKQNDAGLEIAVTDMAVRPGASLSAPLIQEIRSYDKVVALQNINVGDGSFSENADAFVNFEQDGLIVLIRDSSMSHALHHSDISADFASSTTNANSEVIISHDALMKIVANRLSNKALPINGTNATVKIMSYTGAADSVDVTANVYEQSFVFGAAATWSGLDLLLTSYSVKSLKDCSKESLLKKVACEAAKQVETIAAQALVQAACKNCMSTRIVPLTRDNKIEFKLYGRPAFFAAQTVSTVSNDRALIISLDSYIGRRQ